MLNMCSSSIHNGVENFGGKIGMEDSSIFSMNDKDRMPNQGFIRENQIFWTQIDWLQLKLWSIYCRNTPSTHSVIVGTQYVIDSILHLFPPLRKFWFFEKKQCYAKIVLVRLY